MSEANALGMTVSWLAQRERPKKYHLRSTRYWIFCPNLSTIADFFENPGSRLDAVRNGREKHE